MGKKLEKELWKNPEMFKDAESLDWTDLAKKRYVLGGLDTILGYVYSLEFSQDTLSNAINLAKNMWRLGFEKFEDSFDIYSIWEELSQYSKSLKPPRTKVVDPRREGSSSFR